MRRRNCLGMRRSTTCGFFWTTKALAISTATTRIANAIRHASRGQVKTASLTNAPTHLRRREFHAGQWRHPISAADRQLPGTLFGKPGVLLG